MKRLIIGCGYLGRRVAQRWLNDGDEVWALTRSGAHAAELQSMGVRPIRGDVTDWARNGESLFSRELEGSRVDTVLYAVGFDRTALPTKREVYVDGLANMLEQLSPHCKHFVYISSSSVYGQSQGEVVDEESPCQPGTESGQICLAAEQLIRTQLSNSVRSTVLRLTGIYGPGRLLARLDAIRSQQALPGPGDAWLNLIHVDDAAKVVDHVSHQHRAPELLLVTDDEPILRSQYYQALAQAIGAPAPIFDNTVVARHTRGKNKRCRNALLRSLKIELCYPTIASGIPASVE